MNYFYTYRITFVDGYYYFGSRKSKVEPEDDVYWGSPKTHKDKWNTTMFSKQIINVFVCGEDMLNEEAILIGDFYRIDPLCLNQHNNNNFSTIGMIYSQESREKMSKAKANYVPWMKGKTHKEETKKRWSETRRGKIHSSKLTLDDVKRIRQMFDDAPPIQNVEKVMKNGRKMSYERAFANSFSHMFRITPTNLHNIITRRSWTNV